MAEKKGGSEAAAALKEEGNAHYKSGNFLKAAAVYTQAIKADPSNATLYSNRSAAFLNLVKVTKALADSEMTIKLNPTWEKGYFRKGCALEAAERHEEALAVYREAAEKNPQSAEVVTKIKKLTQLLRDRKRNQDKASKSNGSKPVSGIEQLKLDLISGPHIPENIDELFTFLKETVETSVQTWDSTNGGKLDPGVRFLIPKGSTSSTELVHVTVEKAFESPDTFHNCVFSLQEYAVESKAKAACLVVPKRSIAYPQVWKGEGTRTWKGTHSNGIFVQFECPTMRRLWFIPSIIEKGQNVCRAPELLDLELHQVLPPLFR
ncbi:hypothetical protein Mapa_010740 [Marchantia paleacea]|nr:hypothetical protein Mapa_010740 [Marchantia paleacea]